MTRFILIVWFGLALTGCDTGGDAPVRDSDAPAGDTIGNGYVGVKACADCHAGQVRQWTGSHHDLAMAPASEESVVGDFADAKFVLNGVETSFYRRDGEYFVRTDGPDGELAEFPIRYTFGIDPLQQYIVELADGRRQALGVAWDNRDVGDGGQRWFHVYGNEAIDFTDVLHWTGMSQNWDSMCADCHSTAIEKQFDAETGQFDTKWAEINVACEACHGPGAQHVRAAKSGAGADEDGTMLRFDERRDISWLLNKKTGNSRRSQPRTTSLEINVCAACHARRSRISDSPLPAREFLDAFLPALPQPPLYHADGQIQDEVYVYGSFLQSRMFQNGVTCSDCHEPHSLELRAPGSQVCLQCHLGAKFATADHQFLPEASTDVVCIDCHMPTKTYMQVDVRHDHSFRVPRPDLSVVYGTPNVCDDCHADKNASWAVEVLRAAGRQPNETGHWVDGLLAAQATPWDAQAALLGLATNALAPAIIRATAVARLPMGGDPATLALVSERAQSSDPMLRWAVARSLQSSHPAVVANVGPKLLNDPVLAVRVEATSALASVDFELLPPESIADLQRGFDEYIAAQLVNAERPEAQINIGNLQRSRKRFGEAEARYRAATHLNSQFVPAYVNLADLFRAQGRDAEGEALLRSALQRVPVAGQTALHHSLGLTLVRLGRMPEALAELGLAANAANADPQSALAYGLVLDAQGESVQAADFLESALQRFGEYPQLVAALVNVYQRMGDEEAASALATRMRNR